MKNLNKNDPNIRFLSNKLIENDLPHLTFHKFSDDIEDVLNYHKNSEKKKRSRPMVKNLKK